MGVRRSSSLATRCALARPRVPGEGAGACPGDLAKRPEQAKQAGHVPAWLPRPVSVSEGRERARAVARHNGHAGRVLARPDDHAAVRTPDRASATRARSSSVICRDRARNDRSSSPGTCRRRWWRCRRNGRRHDPRPMPRVSSVGRPGALLAGHAVRGRTARRRRPIFSAPTRTPSQCGFFEQRHGLEPTSVARSPATEPRGSSARAAAPPFANADRDRFRSVVASRRGGPPSAPCGPQGAGAPPHQGAHDQPRRAQLRRGAPAHHGRPTPLTDRAGPDGARLLGP